MHVKFQELKRFQLLLLLHLRLYAFFTLDHEWPTEVGFSALDQRDKTK